MSAHRPAHETPTLAATLETWAAQDWSRGLDLSRVEPLQCVRVCTHNTLYEIVVLTGCGDVRVRGGRYFPVWTPACLAGSTSGGSMLRSLGIHIGLNLEFAVGRRRIVTSPVQAITLLDAPTS